MLHMCYVMYYVHGWDVIDVMLFLFYIENSTFQIVLI